MATPSIDVHHRGDRTEIVLPTSASRADAEMAVLAAQAADATGLADIHLVADHPAEVDLAMPEDLARSLGFTEIRTLLRLRRSLPVPADHPSRARAPELTMRPYAPTDATAWLEVNNRAFAAHPDQGQETPATLAARLADPAADPRGFLVADDPTEPGRLAGFCWTKQHPATPVEPAIGEIYVIGADPRHQGTGLGTALVLAGLDHLAGAGLSRAELYVESDNEPARRLYDRLGFVLHDRRRIYSRARP